MEIDDWISVTRLGSDYEHELSPSTNRQRHRQVSFTGVEYPWTPGAPPDMIQPRPPERAKADDRPVARFKYKNHHGKIADRVVSVDALEYIMEPGFEYPPGWFLSGYCHDKRARRSFALNNIIVPDMGHKAFYTLLRFVP